MLGEGKTLALDRMADDRRWLRGVEGKTIEHGRKLRHVVAINLGGAKAESAPLVEQRLELLDLGRRPGGLDLVVVHDGDQIGQAVLARAQRRLPYRSFIDLAVAHDHNDPAVATLHACRQRHSDADREAVAERAGRGFDAGDLAVFRMPTEDRAFATERLEFAGGKVTLVGEHGI